MIINIALWARPELFGDFGNDGRAFWNPFINTFIKPSADELDGHARLADLRDARRGSSWSSARIYYLVAVRGRAPTSRSRPTS